MQIPGFVAAYLRKLFLLGRGPFRWTCLSGEASDLARLDELALEMFPDDETTAKWIELAREHIPIEALPARVCYLGFGGRKAFGLRVNELIRSGEVAGPVAFSRDNLDSGSIVNPTFESENMLDGSDLISDWPYLNAPAKHRCHGRPDRHPGQLLDGRGRAHRSDDDRRRQRGGRPAARGVPDDRLGHRRRPPRPGRISGGARGGQRETGRSPRTRSMCRCGGHPTATFGPADAWWIRAAVRQPTCSSAALPS